MVQLVIKGHQTRGKEVIEILEMLGGKNTLNLAGYTPDLYYHIDNNIIIASSLYKVSKFKIFTVEEFYKEFPYKVGDKVLYHDSKAYIKSMEWGSREIIYTVEWEKELWETTVFYLKPYKEETIEENLTIQDIRDNNAEWLLNKLQEISAKKVLQVISDLYNKLHKPPYPKTYEECCEVLKTPIDNFISKGAGYKAELLSTFQKLLICRDAYWKIAGYEEPDFGKTFIYGISVYFGVVEKTVVTGRGILVFPTEEMRDAFYENFKKLIEACKDFL